MPLAAELSVAFLIYRKHDFHVLTWHGISYRTKREEAKIIKSPLLPFFMSQAYAL